MNSTLLDSAVSKFRRNIMGAFFIMLKKRCWLFFSILILPNYGEIYGQGNDNVLQALQPYLYKLSALHSLQVDVSFAQKYFFREDTLSSSNLVFFNWDTSSPFPALILFGSSNMVIFNRDATFNVSHTAKTVRELPFGWDSARRVWSEELLPPLATRGQWFLEEFIDSTNVNVVYDSSYNGHHYHVFRSVAYAEDTTIIEGITERDLELIFSKNDSMLVAYKEVFKGFGGDQQVRAIQVLTYHIEDSTYTKKRIENTRRMLDSLIDIYRLLTEKEEMPRSPAKKKIRKQGDPIDSNLIAHLIKNGLLSEQLEGRPDLLLLDFWYVECYPCRRAIPELVELRKEYSEKQIAIIGVNPYNDPKGNATVRTLQSLGVNYPQFYGDTGIAGGMGVSGYPTLFLANAKTLEIVNVWDGYSKSLKHDIESVLVNFLSRNKN